MCPSAHQRPSIFRTGCPHAAAAAWIARGQRPCPVLRVEAGLGEVALRRTRLPPPQQVVGGDVGVSWELPTTTKPRLAPRS